MAVTTEVINLISDSEDESPSKAANSTLQAFIPRKEKAASKHHNGSIAPSAPTPQAASDVHDTQRSNAPVATPDNRNGFLASQTIEPLSDILKRNGLHDAARRIALLSPQQGQHQAAVTTTGNTNGPSSRENAPTPRQKSAAASEPQPHRFIQYKPTPKAPKAQEARRTSGPLHEERQRRFNEYHKKETERKSEHSVRPSVEPVADIKASAVPLSVDRVYALAQRSASSSSQPSDNFSEPYWRRRSPQPSGPEAKRRKTDHREVAEDATGMNEARRLSATAVYLAHDLASRDKQPAHAVPSNVFASGVGPNVPPSPNNSSINDKHAPAAANSPQTVDLTEEMDLCIDETEPSIIATQSPGEQEPSENITKLDMSASPHGIADPSESENDSPDEIPAKPIRKRTSTGHRNAPTNFGRTAASSPAVSEASDKPEVRSDFEAGLKTQQMSQVVQKVPMASKSIANGKRNTKLSGNHGIPYSVEEDDLLVHLKETVGISWDEIFTYFSGRTRGSLQVRYSSKLKNRKSTAAKPQSSGLPRSSLPRLEVAQQEYTAPSRRHPKAVHRDDGFVSWAEIKAKRKEESAAMVPVAPATFEQPPTQIPGLGLDFAHPASLPRILRSRELGNTARRNWSSTNRMGVSDELQNHVLDTLGPRRYFHGASRDVTCVAWARDGNKFAAGAIAIDDERSMQYNRPNNLLLGDLEKNSLQELPEHHVTRPAVSDPHNINSLQAMQETQDPRLFKTVAAVEFSEDSRALYSAGGDGFVRMYDASKATCLSSIKHEAEVALLASNRKGLLASGSHRSDDGSISVIRCHSDRLEPVCQLGPSRADVESSLPIFPSSLKWGAGMYSHLLLAGFASDSYDEDRLAAGEIILWDSTADRKIDLPTARNVFDVAWNPFPSSGSSLFAVAGTHPGKINRSSIQCFAPNQGRASRVLEWSCPAFDINDVVYCPHDDNLIAAGATDGKVYIWDKRAANRSQEPLHILAHGRTKNVLDHDRDVEIADTGVRFLSWSATGNRLYSASSDGVVKVWNPYRTTEDALVRDVATFNSAVMSGAFSPDYRDLLIGEDQSQLSLLGIDREERSVRAAKKFDYYPAPVPVLKEDKFAPARELLTNGQIEIRPMGLLPVRQAVQGPNYQGPFLAPSEYQISRMDAGYQAALRGQRDAQTSELGTQLDMESKSAIKAANLQASRAREALEQAQEKREDYVALEPAASLLQKTFHDSRHKCDEDMVGDAWTTCGLDCNYLPAAGDEDGEAPDDRRSEQRIPERLRLQRKVHDTSDMTNAEIADAGLTSKCSACRGPAAKSKQGLPICERCTLACSGFTASCEKCTAPVRPNLDERIQQNICERCDFHCFRCGGNATVSPAGDTVTCEPCDTQWEAGVLGYEVKALLSSSSRMKNRSHERVMESLEQRMGKLLGEDERERLAGGWKVALVDGPSNL